MPENSLETARKTAPEAPKRLKIVTFQKHALETLVNQHARPETRGGGARRLSKMSPNEYNFRETVKKIVVRPPLRNQLIWPLTFRIGGGGDIF